MKIIKVLLKCLLVCVNCFERFIKFISRLGFSYMAVSGKNFCYSCREAFVLLLRNPTKFGFLAIFTEIFIWIGKIAVSALSALLGYILITYI